MRSFGYQLLAAAALLVVQPLLGESAPSDSQASKAHLRLAGRVIVEPPYETPRILLTRHNKSDEGPEWIPLDQPPQAPGPDGRFEFIGLEPGEYAIGPSIVLSPDETRFVDFPYYLERIELRADEPEKTVTLRLPPEGSTLTGYVRNSGALIPNAAVSVSPKGADSRFNFSARTDANGRFIIHGLNEGEHEIAFNLFPPEGNEPQSGELTHKTFHMSGDTRREFQLFTGPELDVTFHFPPSYSEEFLELYDNVTLVLTDWPEEVPERFGDVHDGEARRRTRRAWSPLSGNGTARFRGYFHGEYVFELASKQTGSLTPTLTLPSTPRLDTVDGGVSLHVNVPPPGRLEIRLHGQTEPLLQNEYLPCIIKPKSANDYADLTGYPLADGKVEVEEMPAGQYEFAPAEHGCGITFSPPAVAFEIRSGETTRIEIEASRARVVQFSYAGAPGSRKRRVEVERFLVYGPKFYEFTPEPTGLSGGSYFLNQWLSGSQDIASPDRLRLVNPPPGEYMAEVTAPGFETFTHAFTVTPEPTLLKQSFELKPLP